MSEESTWSVQRCLNWCAEDLKKRGEENPRLAAEWLLTAATGLKRIELYTNFDRPLSMEERARVRSGLMRRRKGEPLQYITGETGFRMLTIACEAGVLIPRPETELLVDAVLEYLDREVLGRGPAAAARRRVELPWNDEVERARAEERERAAQEAAKQQDSLSDPVDATDDGTLAMAADMPAAGEDDSYRAEAEGEPVIEGVAAAPDAAPGALGIAGADAVGSADTAPSDEAVIAPRTARVLEVGCGTGCISLSVAFERCGQVRCVATDIEPRAVALTERNRAKAGLTADDVEVRLGDLIGPITPDELGTFDVLVSNPPYIPTPVMGTLPREVAAFEPHLALDGGADGLDVFRRLIVAAPRVLRPGGLFACELFEDALDDAASLCRAAGMQNVTIAPDLTGRTRFVLARVA